MNVDEVRPRADARTKSILTRPVSDKIGPRRRRRWSVVALYGSYFVLCASSALSANASGKIANVAALVLLIAGIVSATYGVLTLLGRTFVNAPNLRADVLDERQQARRNAALSQAYPIVGMFTAVGLLYMMLSDAWPALRNFTVIEALFWGAFLLAISLPSSIIAWTEPDPLAD